jgi:hypothetical protein
MALKQILPPKKKGVLDFKSAIGTVDSEYRWTKLNL